MDDQTSAVDELLDELPKEGELIHPEEETPVSEDSSPQKEEAATPAVEEDKKTDEENVPFHKHPRFQQMHQKTKDMEAKLQDALKQLEEVKSQPKEESVEVPKWFATVYGDDPDLWKEYSAYDSQQRQAIRAEIINEVKAEMDSKANQETELKQWVDSQLTELQDEGLEFDRKQLLEVMQEFRPTDDQGNLDFRAGHKLLSRFENVKTQATKKGEKQAARKDIAAKTIGQGNEPPKPTVDLRKIRSLDFHQLVQEE